VVSRKQHITFVVIQGLLWLGTACAAQSIDTAKSTMTVRVYKAGVFSALGHDHEIAAPIAGGTVDADARKVEIHVDATALKVRDPNTSDKDRTEIQSTMLGPDVLDAAQHSEIVFRSTSAESAGADSWRVHGALTLHGQTHDVDVEVQGTGGHYRGTAMLHQSDFAIKPVKVAGGAVRVKDEIRVEFDIVLAR
jgi:polyisoprenoid-binding protein YceI